MLAAAPNTVLLTRIIARLDVAMTASIKNHVPRSNGYRMVHTTGACIGFLVAVRNLHICTGLDLCKAKQVYLKLSIGLLNPMTADDRSVNW